MRAKYRVGGGGGAPNQNHIIIIIRNVSTRSKIFNDAQPNQKLINQSIYNNSNIVNNNTHHHHNIIMVIYYHGKLTRTGRNHSSRHTRKLIVQNNNNNIDTLERNREQVHYLPSSLCLRSRQRLYENGSEIRVFISIENNQVEILISVGDKTLALSSTSHHHHSFTLSRLLGHKLFYY